MLEKCANCGAQIGNLEPAHVFRDRVVCATCNARLNPSSSTARSNPKAIASTAKKAARQESKPVRIAKTVLGVVLLCLILYSIAEVKSFFSDRSKDARNAEKARIMRLEGKGWGKTDSELAADADRIKQENIRRRELEETRREVLGK